jgi:hypothetical protein
MPRTRKTAVRVSRPLSPEKRRHLLETRAAAERDKEAIIARGREIKRQREAATAALRETFQLLKQERQAQGVTLQELQDRTGIGRGALSRLENEPDPNPTIRTLQRIASALGQQVIVQLQEASPAR